MIRKQKNKRGTSGGRPQDHWLSSSNAQVPDPVPVAHVLLQQLAQSSRSCGGFKAGHNLSREEREVSMRGLKTTHRWVKIVRLKMTVLNMFAKNNPHSSLYLYSTFYNNEMSLSALQRQKPRAWTPPQESTVAKKVPFNMKKKNALNKKDSEKQIYRHSKHHKTCIN